MTSRVFPSLPPRFAGRTASYALAVVLALGAGTGAWMVRGLHGGKPAPAAGEVTGSLSEAPQQLGPSGLPLPRFVTLKAGKVNVRKGPSSDHAVAWVFQRKGMPVEITAEFENWRKIRDSEGAEGWILQSMLSGKRTILVADWTRNKSVALRSAESENSAAVAKLAPGVMGDVESCDGRWCYVSVNGYEGYLSQTEIWGVYPGESVN